MDNSVMPSSPPSSSRYELDLDALQGASETFNPAMMPRIECVQSDDIEGPTNFTIDMMRLMHSRRPAHGEHDGNHHQNGNHHQRDADHDDHGDNTEHEQELRVPSSPQERLCPSASSRHTPDESPPKESANQQRHEDSVWPTLHVNTPPPKPKNIAMGEEEFHSDFTPAKPSSPTLSPNIARRAVPSAQFVDQDLILQLETARSRCNALEKHNAMMEEGIEREKRAHAAEVQRLRQEILSAQRAKKAETTRRTEVEAQLASTRDELRRQTEDRDILLAEVDRQRKIAKVFREASEESATELAKSRVKESAAERAAERTVERAADRPSSPREKTEAGERSSTRKMSQPNSEASSSSDLQRALTLAEKLDAQLKKAQALLQSQQVKYEKALATTESAHTARLNAAILDRDQVADKHTEEIKKLKDIIKAKDEVNEEVDRRVDNAMRKRESAWKQKEKDWLEERKLMVDTLFTLWGEKECGVENNKDGKQQYRYKYVKRSGVGNAD
ncbi:hypothetical protein K470DRAFT_258613 [Piedraia hortae CBS 480.64]|uniref:Uncharacterized protein n=1 Tax=Piedraia hortae CBS 480.64 TaxID=1314780 RepID=A0A6A7BYJ0_9PEZI|nr:hypothetical protein K470DRAFT_258613 [Piedraia hortae CBS 480.64]